ncbi:MAG: DUF3137 domain-containing protein [Clostridiales bacterium]|nr:DUF3137 domain-containing protein [Clostridiales bacterium]
MEMTEQNINGVKLEKLRKDAVKKMKIVHHILPVCMVFFGALVVAGNRHFFVWLGESGWGEPAVQGAFFSMLSNLLLAFVFAAVIYLFYAKLVWQKAYDRFNTSFKNKYVLDNLRQMPGFSELRYNASGGFSYDEINLMNLIPKGNKVFYHSSDELTGLLDGIRFRSSNVQTGQRGKYRRSLPDVLFEGQIIAFSNFDDRKISDGFVQVFSKKVLVQVKDAAVPLKIQTENSLFNENFVVFAENEQNAFYILTPSVLETITTFQEAMEGKVYLAFYQSTLYVTCSQFHNPFDAYIDIPVEEQCRLLEKDTSILRNAREILIRAGQKRQFL